MSSTPADYRSPRTLSFLAIAPLSGILGINVFNIILGFAETIVPQQLHTKEGDISLWLGLIVDLGFLEGILRVLAAILFLVWLFRIFKNLAPTLIRNPEHPPSWAIIVWFIPLANLLKPYQVMQQAWRDTDPDSDPDLGYVTSKTATNPLITGWWITFIVSTITVKIGGAIAKNTSEAQTVLTIMIISFIVAIAAFLAILVVREITVRQIKRAEKIRDLDAYASPPPPPTFS